MKLEAVQLIKRRSVVRERIRRDFPHSISIAKGVNRPFEQLRWLRNSFGPNAVDEMIGDRFFFYRDRRWGLFESILYFKDDRALMHYKLRWG